MREIKTEILIDENQKEPKIIIVTDSVTEEIKKLQEQLSQDNKMSCFDERGVRFVYLDDIIRVYAQNGSVFVETETGLYNLHERLYELEQKLDSTIFVRISKSEIVNSNKILKLNIKLTGTIGIELENNITSFVSRRYVAKIKEFFGLRGATDEK